MGLLSRMMTVIKAKMSTLLDRAEDPRETMEYSYEKQLELLRNMKRGVVEVVTSKRRLELQAATLRQNIDRLQEQAQQAVNAGRDDLARTALQRRQLAQSQMDGLSAQITDLEKEQQKLTDAEARLSAKIEAFRTRKEVIKAQYSAAEAQVRIGEAVSGISEELADVGLAVDRAEEKTNRLRARVSAIDELTASGVLADATAPGGDSLSQELAQLQTGQNVEAELATLKRQIPGAQAKQLGGGGAQ